MSHVVILSGPSGAGKSSVAEALAQRYDRTVHLETDLLFRAIRMGFIHPMQPESDRQNRMIARAAARAASAFAQDLFAVFVDGVIGPHLLPIYVDELKVAAVPVHFVLLLPSVEESIRRVKPRAASAFAQDLFAVFIDGVIGPHLLPIYVDELKVAAVPVHVVLLLPSVEESIRRVKPRAADRRMIEAEHRELHRQFAGHGEFAGCVIDNTAMTAEETADVVMEACGRGDCLVYTPA